MIHDLVLVACGFVFAYLLDVYRYTRRMRLLRARMRTRITALQLGGR
jgi:hypothetical protein